MQFTFEPLKECHFEKLLGWLNAPHIKPWWDVDVVWTEDLIHEKYQTYVDGYKIVEGQKKPLSSFVMCVDGVPVGYCQWYGIHDFFDESVSKFFPQNTAMLDFFIGDEKHLRQGLATAFLEKLLKDYVFRFYRYCVVDPLLKNEPATQFFLKSGFKILKHDGVKLWLVMHQEIVRLSGVHLMTLELCFKNYFDRLGDSLWIFGSRANLLKKGGDLDLYIETDEKDKMVLVKKKNAFLSQLALCMGQQKIDLIIKQRQNDYHLPIYDVAKREGVQIV